MSLASRKPLKGLSKNNRLLYLPPFLLSKFPERVDCFSIFKSFFHWIWLLLLPPVRNGLTRVTNDFYRSCPVLTGTFWCSNAIDISLLPRNLFPLHLYSFRRTFLSPDWLYVGKAAIQTHTKNVVCGPVAEVSIGAVAGAFSQAKPSQREWFFKSRSSSRVTYWKGGREEESD